MRYIFSTPGDMAKWASFLLGATEAPGVLDPSSVLELRNSAMLQADGTASGTIFAPDGIELYLDSVAMINAYEIYR